METSASHLLQSLEIHEQKPSHITLIASEKRQAEAIMRAEEVIVAVVQDLSTGKSKSGQTQTLMLDLDGAWKALKSALLATNTARDTFTIEVVGALEK